MAFNPFHSFRKHQKVFFAALTIICMLTFVMAGGSFAGGDFFSELTRLLTGGRSRIQEVARIYGKNVSDREIQDLRRQRRLANDFMLQAVSQARHNVFENVRKYISQFDPADQNQLQEILFRAQIVADPRISGTQFIQEYLSNLQVYLMQLQLIDRRLVEAKKPNELLIALRKLQAALERDYWLFRTPKDELYPEENLYFGGSLSDKGLLDFLLWRQQADRLGIYLTTDDIAKLYRQETLDSVTAWEIQKQVLGETRLSKAREKNFLTALGDEFRVRMAQAALVGYDPGGHVGQVPTSITPYEFWEDYRSNRTELALKLLPLPLQKFLPEVKEQPKPDELEALFEKYKGEEYAPDKETPGFKQPRRLKIEWLSASADSPYYRKLAQQSLVSFLAAVPGNPYLPLALLDPLVSEYESLKWVHFRSPALTVGDFAGSFYSNRYFQRPQNVAAIVGQAAGTIAARATPLSILAAYQGAAILQTQKELAPVIAHEVQRRLPLSVAFFSAGSGLQPMLALAGIWHYAAKIDQFLPMDLVKGQLVRKVQENVAGALLTESLKAFKEQLEVIRKEVETKKIKVADALKQVEKVAAEHGWAHGAMTELRDQYEINRDAKALAPLKEAYMRIPQNGDAKGKFFAQRLFFGKRGERGEPWKNFTPQELSAGPSPTMGEKKRFLYWKSEDQPAKVLTFAQAKSQVLEAWRMEKARALAKAKADELAKQAREAHGDYLPILNEAAKRYAPVFDLTGVARWVKPSLSSRANPFAPYQRYVVPEDKIDYPSLWPNFVDPLLASLKEPGDTTVITNRPKDVYYVVALAGRNPPSVQDFYKETTRNRDLLLAQLELERQKNYREAYVAMLANAAHLSINPEGMARLKERPDLREE